MISIEKLSVQYGNNVIYRDVNMEIPDKGINFLMGKNGAGKTTLVKCLLDFMRYKGSIIINGHKYSPDKKDVFAVFDDASLYANLTGLQNIMLITGTNRNDAIENSEILLSKSLLNKKVKTYSYGERKKVLLIIVDILRPRVLLMDEVSNGLDYETMLLLKSRIQVWANNTLMILTGHQFEFYKDIVDRIYVINGQKIKCIEKEDNRTLEEIYEESIK